MMELLERIIVLHHGLDEAEVPHAFGGALALAYCTSAPRGTTDIDINVFVEPTEAERVVGALPRAVTVRQDDKLVLARDGQVRLWWERTPVDLFLNVHAFHEEVATRVLTVPFGGTQIPVLDCVSLTVFKAMFNRDKDWVDIAAMIDAGGLPAAAAVDWLERILGDDHETTRRLAALVG